MADELDIEIPPECECGWKPVRITNDKQVVNPENMWIFFEVPMTGICIFICPSCQRLRANPNVVENTKIMKAIAERRIIVAPSGGMPHARPS